MQMRSIAEARTHIVELVGQSARQGTSYNFGFHTFRPPLAVSSSTLQSAVSLGPGLCYDSSPDEFHEGVQPLAL